MKVAEVYASLGIEADKRSMGRARDQFGKFLKGAERDAEIASKRAGRGFWKNFAWGDQERRSLYRSGRMRDIGAFGMADAMGSRLAGVGMMGGAAFTAAGVMGLRDSLKFDAQLSQMDISSKGAMGSMDDVRRKILEVSAATGVAKEQIAAGAQSFVALTGDGDAASKSMLTFARVQKATGAATSEIAATAAALSQQLGVMPTDMEDAFSVLTAGGKAGAVEFSDMASLMASLSASFKGFDRSQGLGGVAQLGAMFQIARQDFGSAAETATGLERLMQQMSTPRTLKAFKKLGIEVFEVGKNGEVTKRALDDILDDMSKTALATDDRVMNRAFESSEAQRTAKALLNNIQAVRDLARETISAKDIATDFAKAQESSSARVSKAWNQVKVGIAEAFNPDVLANFAEAAEAVVGLGSKGVQGWSQYIDHAREAAGGRLTKTTEAKQLDALRLFSQKTGFSNKAIAKMSKDEIIAHAGRVGILDQIREHDIGSIGLPALSRGMSPFGIAEASKRESALDAGLVDARERRANTMENIVAGVQRRSIGSNADAIRGLTVTNQITINGVSGSADQIGNLVTRHLTQFWDRKMIELGGSR